MSSSYIRGSDYDKAMILYENGMLFEARQRAEEVSKDDPNFKSARKLISEINAVSVQIARRHIELGDEYEKAGIYQKAVEEYSISLKYNPNILIQNRVANLQEALKEGRKPDIEKAEQKKKPQPKKEEKEDPELIANLHYMKGKMYYESKMFGKAVDEFSIVLKTLPAYMNAKDLFAKSKKERDKEVDKRLKRGISYFQTEEMDLAIKEWDAVLELDPLNKTAADYKNRAEVIMERLRKIRERQTSAVEQPT